MLHSSEGMALAVDSIVKKKKSLKMTKARIISEMESENEKVRIRDVSE